MFLPFLFFDRRDGPFLPNFHRNNMGKIQMEIIEENDFLLNLSSCITWGLSVSFLVSLKKQELLMCSSHGISELTRSALALLPGAFRSDARKPDETM
jgi:hypothetical protein